MALPPSHPGAQAPAPAAPAPAPVVRRPGAPPGATAAVPPPTDLSRFKVLRGVNRGDAQRVMIYGPGGIGKSTLASLAPGAVILDLESGARRLDAARIADISTWGDLRGLLQSSALDEFSTIVIDSATKAEEFAVAHTLKTVRTEKGQEVTSVEGYGFGKGYQHVYETWMHLLVDLDRHVRAGRNVVLVSHVCTAKVPNPKGEDWIRYEPRLQQTKEGKASIRNRVVEWCDHVLYVGYDIATTEEGKGIGGASRMIYTRELPTHLAKVRELDQPINARPYPNAGDASIWPLLLGTEIGGAS